MKNIIRHIIVSVGLIALANPVAIGQFQDPNDVPKANSPLSSIGLGDIQPLGTGTIDSWGSLYAAFQDPYAINLVNPASLTSLSVTAFETGLYLRNSRFSQGNDQQSVWAGNLDYIALAFPTKNISNETFQVKPSTFKHSMSLSLAPYSVVGYDILDTGGSINGQPVEDNFQGKGGTFRFLWGNAVKYKNLSFGVNVGYLFGNIEQQRSLSLTESELSFATISYDLINIRGGQWNAGLQYNIPIKSREERKSGEERVDNQIILGVYGNSSTRLTSITDNITSRGIPNFGSFLALDTLQNVTDVIDEGRLPSQFGFGALYYITDVKSNFAKFKVGFNYSTTGWSDFVLAGRNDRIGEGDATSFSLGAQWLPDAFGIKYRKRIRYRIGLKFETDPRFIQGEQLNTSALQLGLGLPLVLPRGRVSLINLSLELGTINSNSIDETYGRIGVGFTLNDNQWFLKRKLN